ncbi:hypothetical protein RJ640_011461 [Escallonia rubra]|uniref:Uncharacterized protein n=1 Tax=Escallonia rubra TaxID=112253 RepID=A0AA88UF96_9ASTE|nr:hypothetical protein RJ640_011461 [Escallonia rubra]
MANLPFQISASDVMIPSDFDAALTPLNRGTREAADRTMLVPRNAGTPPLASCWKTSCPLASSAPMAATNPIMASRPLITSGAGPLNASTSETRHSGAQLPSHCRELAEISNTLKPLKEQNDRSYEEPNDRTSNAYTPWVPDPVTGYYRPENRAKELDPPGIFRLDPPGIFRLDRLGIRSSVSLTLLLNFFFPFSFAAWSSLLSREWRSGTRVDDAGIALCYTFRYSTRCSS